MDLHFFGRSWFSRRGPFAPSLSLLIGQNLMHLLHTHSFVHCYHIRPPGDLRQLIDCINAMVSCRQNVIMIFFEVQRHFFTRRRSSQHTVGRLFGRWRPIKVEATSSAIESRTDLRVAIHQFRTRAVRGGSLRRRRR